MAEQPDIRVAMVCDWFFYYAASLADALSRRTPLLFVTRDHGLELGLAGDASAEKRALLPANVGLEIVRGRQRDPLSLLSANAAGRHVRSFRPDVVHVQDHSDWRLERIVGSTRRPFVLTLHDVVPHLGSEDWRRNGVQRGVSERLRRDASAFLVHGRALEEQLRAQPWFRGQPVHVVPLGAHAHPAARGPLPHVPTVLFFGRLEEYKGLDVFVRACELAADDVPGLRAIVAGDGSQADAVRRTVTRPEIFDWRVGFVADAQLPSLFAEASAVVLPYLEASQSGVVPVAFANGRPVVATRVGALAEAVADGHDGVLVGSPRPRDVADAIVGLLRDRAKLERLSAAALETAESGRLSPQTVAREHLRVYRSVLGVRGRDRVA
jgi:glycosyltransferase involved in cell wall biosynthesis